MNLELDESERRLLADLMETLHRNKLHELHHTATIAYKQALRRDIEIIERLKDSLTAAEAGAGR
jgi:hypothetical protein